MTTNNEVKAERPCTLPKEWKGERTFNVCTFTEIEYLYEKSDYWTPDCDVCGFIRINVYIKTNASIDPFRRTQWYDKEEDAVKEAQLFSMEAIQAIASAQRPWLDINMFEARSGTVIELLHKDSSRSFGKFDGINAFDMCWSDGSVYNEESGVIEVSEIKAFKPISDSQEAWYAVAHVKVYKELV